MLLSNVLSQVFIVKCYFLNEMKKGNLYYDLLKVFNIHNTMYNEKFIEQYFKNM